MASSNMDVVTTVDIEAQPNYPKWFVNHKHMLRPNQEPEVNELGYSILKVPQSRRQPLQEFSSQEWRFGLHNREKMDSSGSQAIKLGLALQYGLVGVEWDHFCDAIVDNPKAMLACYGLHNGVTTWTDEQIKHVLALDALFLAIYIDEGDLDNLIPLNQYEAMEMFWERHRILYGMASFDLFQVENEIPFVLIDKVVKYINNFIAFQICEDYEQKSLECVARNAISNFMATPSETFKIDGSYLLREKTHILGVAYKVICGREGLDMKRVSRRTFIHVPSTTKLEQSGIKIIGVDGALCTMSYKKNCLSLPKMRIFDMTLPSFETWNGMRWKALRTVVFSMITFPL